MALHYNGVDLEVISIAASMTVFYILIDALFSGSMIPRDSLVTPAVTSAHTTESAAAQIVCDLQPGAKALVDMSETPTLAGAGLEPILQVS